MKRVRKVLITGIAAGLILTLVLHDLQASRKEQIEKDITQKKKDIGDIKKEISVTR